MSNGYRIEGDTAYVDGLKLRFGPDWWQCDCPEADPWGLGICDSCRETVELHDKAVQSRIRYNDETVSFIGLNTLSILTIWFILKVLVCGSF